MVYGICSNGNSAYVEIVVVIGLQGSNFGDLDVFSFVQWVAYYEVICFAYYWH